MTTRLMQNNIYPRPLSHSSMSCYKECPLKFKYRYIIGLKEPPKHYFSFGRSVHKALEFYYQSPLFPPSVEELLGHFSRNWIKEGYAGEAEESRAYQEGIRILQAFHFKHSAQWVPAFKTEFSFTVDLDGVAVTGKVDRLDLTPGDGMNITDYKTGREPHPSRALHDPQLTLYQLACEREFNIRVERLMIYHVPTLKSLDAPRRPDSDLRRLCGEIWAVRVAINQQRFDPLPEPLKCRRCGYRTICPAAAAEKLPVQRK